MHVRRRTERARRGQPHPVPRSHRETREHRRPVGRGRAEAGPSQRLGRLLLPPERQVGTGQALVRGAEQQDRELVTHREHELQVGDHLVRPPGIRGSTARLGRVSAGQQLRQGQAAEVLWQAEVHGRGLVQLGDRRGHVIAGADLEEAGQSARRGIGGVSARTGPGSSDSPPRRRVPLPARWPGSPPCSGLLPASWPPPSAIRASDCGKLVQSQDFLSGEVEPQPVICLMDDEQWLDRASVPALAFVDSRRKAQSVGLLFAAWPGEPAMGQLAGERAFRGTAIVLGGAPAVPRHDRTTGTIRVAERLELSRRSHRRARRSGARG